MAHDFAEMVRGNGEIVKNVSLRLVFPDGLADQACQAEVRGRVAEVAGEIIEVSREPLPELGIDLAVNVSHLLMDLPAKGVGVERTPGQADHGEPG